MRNLLAICAMVIVSALFWAEPDTAVSPYCESVGWIEGDTVWHVEGSKMVWVNTDESGTIRIPDGRPCK